MEMKMGTPYVLLEEQETIIRYGRLDDYATICTSDTTQKTRFDKLCKNSPDHWKKTDEDEIFCKYKCTPKSLISTRLKVTERNYTDEQKAAMAERLQNNKNKPATIPES